MPASIWVCADVGETMIPKNAFKGFVLWNNNNNIGNANKQFT